jgi:hypothetical protein
MRLIQVTNAASKKPVWINPAHVVAIHHEAGTEKVKVTRVMTVDGRLIDTTAEANELVEALLGENE